MNCLSIKSSFISIDYMHIITNLYNNHNNKNELFEEKKKLFFSKLFIRILLNEQRIGRNKKRRSRQLTVTTIARCTFISDTIANYFLELAILSQHFQIADYKFIVDMFAPERLCSIPLPLVNLFVVYGPNRFNFCPQLCLNPS
ncbi:hypothetical protein BpHYR1_000633 [Brachionus plicatilis]|uniref:Uncharacterized protein n=1 Tax=Brachionus plicatilis TaxID=10195 RepID=A0A3M7R9W4_BRAPC|nr:hypothetical protein BpHYR1_000633 [Brachionus plicatilis]